MTVKRYTLNGDRMFPHSEGRWVFGEDHDALAAELASIKAHSKFQADCGRQTSLALIDAGIKSFGFNADGVKELAAERDALRQENERLVAENKARAEYLTTRRAGNDVDSYVNLAEAEIAALRSRLAGMEAAWRNACERGDKAVARLAEVDSALGAWGRNEAGDSATIIRIAKAVGAMDTALKGITPDRENECE